MNDNINNPSHYTNNGKGIECFNYINSHNMTFAQANVIKYVTRYKFKGGLEDLNKASWYLDKLKQEYPETPKTVDKGKFLVQKKPKTETSNKIDIYSETILSLAEEIDKMKIEHAEELGKCADKIRILENQLTLAESCLKAYDDAIVSMDNIFCEAVEQNEVLDMQQTEYYNTLREKQTEIDEKNEKIHHLERRLKIAELQINELKINEEYAQKEI